MSILETILAEQRKDLAERQRAVPLAVLRRQAAGRTHRSLRERLAAGSGTRIVAEMKKASPSAGVLVAAYDPAGLGRIYAAAGAAGISVLTEPRHFLGSGEHLRAVRKVVDLPILRKDFLCDPYQVWEAAAWGADVVLLIVAALEPRALREMYETATQCGLEVLVEAHTEDELDRALELEQAIVGVNSRDLRTLRTDLAVAQRLAKKIPAGRVAIAESGIRTRDDVLRLEGAGYRGFLVGETLLKAQDPGEKLRELRGEGRV